MKSRRIGIDARCLQDGSVFRGTGRYLRGLLMGIDSCESGDFEYELVLDDGEDWEHRDPPGLGEDGRLHGYPTQRATLQVKQCSWLRRNWILNRSLRGLDLDLLHVPAQFYLYYHQWLFLPYVVTVLDLIPFIKPDERSIQKPHRYRRRLSRLTTICQRAAGVIAISAHTRDDCVRMMDLAPERITVIPLGVEDRFRVEGCDDDDVLFRHGLHKPYVLYVGAQDSHKNVDTLIRAIDALRRAGRDLQLAIVGRKCEEPPGEGTPWVHYPDYVPDEDLPAVYRGAAVFATLSTYEGFCLPALEAMACGTPVIASNTSVFPETVGDAGLTVDPLDVDAAARAIGRVLDDALLAEELRKRGLARAQSYRWDEVGRAHVEVYRRVLERSR